MAIEIHVFLGIEPKTEAPAETSSPLDQNHLTERVNFSNRLGNCQCANAESWTKSMRRRITIRVVSLVRSEPWTKQICLTTSASLNIRYDIET
ncbi:hypothetical protein YC2023_116086 [Brassica napus]